jgi:hypothetical protein
VRHDWRSTALAGDWLVGAGAEDEVDAEVDAEVDGGVAGGAGWAHPAARRSKNHMGLRIEESSVLHRHTFDPSRRSEGRAANLSAYEQEEGPPMNAKQKIERLTNAWYGYSVFSAVVSLFGLRASGPLAYAIGFGFSIAASVIALLVSLAIVTFFGRMLIGRSSATRTFLVFFSGLFTLLGVFGVFSSSWAFLQEWSLAALSSAVLSVAGTMMNLRSFRVLRETSVRAYFA